jgi:hypothetical protein
MNRTAKFVLGYGTKLAIRVALANDHEANVHSERAWGTGRRSAPEEQGAGPRLGNKAPDRD